MKMNNLDRFQSDYHNYHFPDAQDKEVIKYSTCAGCGETVSTDEVMAKEILDILNGVCVHDDCSCIKKAVSARTMTIDEITEGE